MNLERSLVIDISPPISEQLAVWPGDVPFTRKEQLSFGQGDHLALSSIESTVHLGAHVDAPCHYDPQGGDMASRSLDYYKGDCQVVEVDIPRGKRILPKDIKQEIVAKRVLFKTNSYPDPCNFNRDFNALSEELVDFLAHKGAILVGIDTPSVDSFDDKQLQAHQAICRNDMAILEGIALGHVSPGKYQLIALPLPIKGADASPVRAVLIGEKG